MLSTVKVSIFPKPLSFTVLKKKYKHSIEKFYMDFKERRIPYVKYIENYQTLLEQMGSLTNKFSNCEHIIIIGIGGIVNGTKAIFNALASKAKKEVVFIDNPGYKLFHTLQNHFINHFNAQNDLVILVSKSGTTLETLVQSSFFLNIFSSFLNTKNIVVMTSEAKSSLTNFAVKNNLTTCYLPKDLGGRFSHFYSAYLPLQLCGIDFKKVFDGAKRFISVIEKDFINSKFLHFTLNLCENIKKNKVDNVVFLNYIDRLDALTYFFVQLWDESLGKKYGRNLRFPTCAINALCPREQHAQLQAFLEGKHNKLLFFIAPAENFSTISFEDSYFFNKKFDLTSLLFAQAQGVLGSFLKEKLPIVWTEIGALDEEFVGEFLSFFSLMVILIGYLFNLNPYTQDAVELYKKLTRIYLGLEPSLKKIKLTNKLYQF
jgi:glucose-6-phosphate isomerase